MAQSREIVDKAYERYEEAVQKQNQQIKRTLKVAIGDLVWVQQEPQKGRIGKLDSRFTGPSVVEQKADGNGVTYVCKMRGRKVTYRTVHLSRMKKSHRRESRLDTTDTSNSPRTTTSDSLAQLLDRRYKPEEEEWEYKFVPRSEGPATELWLSEGEAKKLYTLSGLDTFHALFELKHCDQMPRHAKRRRSAPKNKKLTRGEALAKYPMGTLIAPEDDSDALIPGEIAGYRQPYWRARYTDGI
jgi:hypothetical protein